MADEIFKVPPKVRAIDGLMSLAIIVRAILSAPDARGHIVWVSDTDPRLVLDGVEELVDREPQWSELLRLPVGSKRAWWGI